MTTVQQRDDRQQLDGTRMRVLFMLTVAAEDQERFLEAYELIRHEVARVPGHVRDQVCQSTTEPERWLITSEWRHSEDFERWERSDEHRALVAPLRACVSAPVSMRFAVRRQTP